ncbi:MAG: restriction endonuclease subunit S, partial [Patescibacteria group bacterium]
LFAEVKDRNHPDEPLLSVTIAKGIIRQSDLLANSSKKDSSNEDKTKYKLVQPRDIAYNKMRAWQGAVGVSNYRGIVSPAYIVVRPRGEQNTEYFHYLLRTPAFAKEAERWSYGITSDQWSLRAQDFKQIYCSLPPKEEQDCIVKFIAHKDRRISRFIHNKRRLIELLNEQKQAIIHRAVTRGLDLNVRLKPSGVEWLGDVPEHWSVLRVKQCAKTISKGTTPSTEGREILENGTIRFLKAENINNGKITNKPLCFIDEETHNILKRSQLKVNDILFVIAGATLGKIAVIQGNLLPANTNQAVSFVRPNNRVLPEYLAMWLQSSRVKELIWLNAVQSAQPNLSMADLGNFLMPLPPKKEQSDILGWLDAHLAALNSSIDSAHREISLIREYRTRLISDVVTGKLDVRSMKLPAMDETETLEDIDNGEDTEAQELIESEEVADADE